VTRLDVSEERRKAIGKSERAMTGWARTARDAEGTRDNIWDFECVLETIIDEKTCVG
jgi:hypothetical protein